jgi:hypothetical protein
LRAKEIRQSRNKKHSRAKRGCRKQLRDFFFFLRRSFFFFASQIKKKKEWHKKR